MLLCGPSLDLTEPAMASLTDFYKYEHHGGPPRVPLSSRVTALALTAALYGLLLLLAFHRTGWVSLHPHPASEIVTRLVTVPATTRDLPPKVPVQLVRPRAPDAAPPSFTVASAPAPATLPPSATQSSPLAGGVPDSTGAGQNSIGISTGIAGAGARSGSMGCYDASWAQAVTDRIGKFFYYPEAARIRHARGVVLVHFILRRNGRLDQLEIATSSGDPSLDYAARDMVRRSQPLPPIPDRMRVDTVDAIMPIAFGKVGQAFKSRNGTCPPDPH
jgi:protein TonB